MTTKVKLSAQARSESNGKAQKIRTAGFIPAVVYGSKKENYNIKIKKHDFERVFAAAGEFNLVDLSIDDATTIKVIIKDVQRNGITNEIIHVDFYQVDMTKKIITEIPLNFIGESKAVKELGGTLVKNMDSVEVKCLPGDLVSHIDVDLSKLEIFGQFIRLHDLILPNGIILAHETNEAVVGVEETKIEKEEPKPVEAEAAAAPVQENADEAKQETTEKK